MPSRLYGRHILLRSNPKSSPASRLSRCSGLAAHARAWFAPFDPQTGCRNAQSMSTPSKRVDGARTAREIHGNGIHRRVYHAPGDPHDGAVLRRRLVTVSWGFRVECVVSPQYGCRRTVTIAIPDFLQHIVARGGLTQSA